MDYATRRNRRPHASFADTDQNVMRGAMLLTALEPAIEYVDRDGHQCPTTKHTKRALRMAIPVRKGDEDALKRRRIDTLYMKAKGLCRTCGYPLDNSLPHPLVEASGLRW